MPTSAKEGGRATIYLNENIVRLLRSGSVRGTSASGRIDQLAARYEVLVRQAMPRRLELTTPECLLLAALTKASPISHPDHALLLPAKLQRMSDENERVAGVDLGSLAYRLRSLKHAELLAVVDLVERLLAVSEEPTREHAQQILDASRG